MNERSDDNLDWDKIVEEVSESHTEFKCSCGGSFRWSSSALMGGDGVPYYDQCYYVCEKCGETTSRTHDVPHLNELRERGPEEALARK